MNRINTILKNFGVSVLTLDVNNSVLKLQVKSESKTKLAEFTIPDPEINNIPDGLYIASGSILNFPFGDEVHFTISSINESQYILEIKDFEHDWSIYSGIIQDAGRN